MKKFLLSAFAALACVATASADEVKFDFTTNAYGQHVYGTGDDKDYMTDGTTITEGNINVTANKLTGSGVRFWKTDSGAQTFRVMKNSGITVSIDGGTISKIVFTGTNNNNLAVDGTKITDQTWEGTASSSIAFVNTGSTVQIKSMTVTYTGGVADTRKDADLEFSDEAVTIEMGDAFTEPQLTKATTAPVTFSSDKTTVATVDATTGKVTVVGLGTARITAKAEANDEYKAGSASYLLTVKEKIVAPEGSVFFSALGEGFSFDNPEGIEVWSVDNRYGLKGSAFVGGKVTAAVAVAYTTEYVDLSNKKNISLQFKNAFNQYKLNNNPIDIADFNGYAELVVRTEGETAWTLLGTPTAPEAFSWNFFDNAPVSLDAYKGKKIQLGFRYISTAEVAGTWEVQRIAVVAEDDQSAIESVVVDENAPVEYFNLQGVRVANPENGLYIRRQGNTVTKVIVK